MRLLVFITDCGDSAVLLATMLALAGYLYRRGQRHAAMRICLAFLLASLGIGVLKIVFMGCVPGFLPEDVRTPSGHSALSAALFLSIGLLAVSGQGRFKIQVLIACCLWFAAIAWTRVALGFHSAHEAAIGMALGVVSAFTAQALRPDSNSKGRLGGWGVMLCVAVPAILLNGVHLPAEEIVRWLAFGMRAHTSFCGQ